MIEKLKSKTIGYWLMSVAILAAIVGIVLFAVYKNRGGEGIPAIFAFAAIGIACQVILFFYDGKFGALFAIAAVVMYALALGFNYYVQIGEKDRAKELLAQLKSCKNVSEALVNDCQLTYEIVFRKRYDFIDQMEKMLKKANPQLQGKLCFLLAKQYANKGDKTHAKLYRRRYEELARTSTSGVAS